MTTASERVEPTSEREVVCERCGEIIETEPVPVSEANADRLIPAEDCSNCADVIAPEEGSGD